MGSAKIVALIPARAGSKRIKDKNIRCLAGHPLIAYTISAAIESNIFDRIVVSTDSSRYAEIAEYYGAESPFLRTKEISNSSSPDIDFVNYSLNKLEREGYQCDFFSILRPTSPFRRAATIVRAWKQMQQTTGIDSIRAVQKCAEHPGKMWVLNDSEFMSPLLPFSIEGVPWHSNQYPKLPEVYIQNASLEIARTSVLKKYSNISGFNIAPFLTDNFEGFDINYEYDWQHAESVINLNGALLPVISKNPYNI